jgi:hypothetical protein
MYTKIQQTWCQWIFRQRKQPFYIHKEYIYIPQTMHIHKKIFGSKQRKHFCDHKKSSDSRDALV